MESASSCSASSSKFFLGCSLLGSTFVILTSCSFPFSSETSAAPSFAFFGVCALGMSASSPFPNPLPLGAICPPFLTFCIFILHIFLLYPYPAHTSFLRWLPDIPYSLSAHTGGLISAFTNRDSPKILSSASRYF